MSRVKLNTSVRAERISLEELIVVIDLLTSEFPDTDLTPGPLSEMLTQRLRKTVTPEDIHRYHAYVAALESEDIKLWYNLNLTS